MDYNVEIGNVQVFRMIENSKGVVRPALQVFIPYEIATAHYKSFMDLLNYLIRSFSDLVEHSENEGNERRQG